MALLFDLCALAGCAKSPDLIDRRTCFGGIASHKFIFTACAKVHTKLTYSKYCTDGKVLDSLIYLAKEQKEWSWKQWGFEGTIHENPYAEARFNPGSKWSTNRACNPSITAEFICKAIRMTQKHTNGMHRTDANAGYSIYVNHVRLKGNSFGCLCNSAIFINTMRPFKYHQA